MKAKPMAVKRGARRPWLRKFPLIAALALALALAYGIVSEMDYRDATAASRVEGRK